MQQSFARVGVEGIEYYLLTKLVDGGKEGFELAISNGEQVWRAVVEASKIQSLAKAVDLDVSEFASQTARALTCQATSQDNFVYHAKRQGSSLQFAWKKHIGDGVKFQLGSLILSKVTDSAAVIKNIFDLAVDQMAELKEEMSSLRSDNARLSSERRDALKLLDKCVSAKEEIETDLFQKFAAVLNDKKSKIRQLKIQVNDAVSSTPAPAVKDNKSPECSKRVKKNSETLSRNESSGDDTDIEKMESGDESSKPRSLSPTGANERSKVHEKPSSAMFSPSLLLEDDNEDIQPAVKRRRRRDVKPKESPAPKLVLPKVPSVKKTPSNSSGESSTSSRPRLRQRASEKSSPDADDLMAEMEM